MLRWHSICAWNAEILFWRFLLWGISGHRQLKHKSSAHMALDLCLKCRDFILKLSASGGFWTSICAWNAENLFWRFLLLGGSGHQQLKHKSSAQMALDLCLKCRDVILKLAAPAPAAAICKTRCCKTSHVSQVSCCCFCCCCFCVLQDALLSDILFLAISMAAADREPKKIRKIINKSFQNWRFGSQNCLKWPPRGPLRNKIAFGAKIGVPYGCLQVVFRRIRGPQGEPKTGKNR